MTTEPIRIVLIAWLAIATLVPTPVSAADAPSGSPHPTGLSCIDRYPAEGPAGIDLRLGCLLGRLVDAYTGGNPDGDAAPLSSYAITLGSIAGLGVLAGLLVREVRRRAGRRLAPTLATTWWSCPVCRSLNRDGTLACYSCGSAQPADVAIVTRTDPPGE